MNEHFRANTGHQFIRLTRAKIYLIILLLLLVALEVGVIWTKANAAVSKSVTGSVTHQVILTLQGFSPDTLEIVVGDTVSFVNQSDNDFWPASDLHPGHEVMPEFDSGKPLPPGETYKFTFSRPGRFGFHDHLRSIYKGTIYVKETNNESLSLECEPMPTDEFKLQQCWESAIRSSLKYAGVSRAFEVLAEFYTKYPDFAVNCHDYTHLIGEEAYRQFATDREKLKLTTHTSYCGYGFYHGFMEILLLTSGDTEEAREFCSFTQNLTGLRSSYTACYHGIGHGTVDGADERAWGDIEAIMKPGFKMCEAVAGNDFEMYLCATGVYNSTERLSTDPKYGIEHLNDDPFALCNNQPVDYQEACYTNMIPAVLRLAEGDFDSAANYIITKMNSANEPTIDSYATGEMVVLSLAHEFINRYQTETDYVDRSLEFCRRLKAPYHTACIEGLSGGHMKYGEPEREYVRMLEFCGSSLLTADEKHSCYKHSLSRLRNWYLPEKTAEICEMVDEEYRGYCR